MARPEILEKGFKIEEEKLWAMDVPVEEIPISEIEYNLDIPYLDKMGTDDWNLTPRILVENLEQEPEHAKVMMNADLKYPIEIYYNKGKWIILDGVHRFAKTVWQGNTVIKVRRFSNEMIIELQNKAKI